MGKVVYEYHDLKRLAGKIGHVPANKYQKVFDMLTKDNDDCFKKSKNAMHIDLKSVKGSVLHKVETYIDSILEKVEEVEIEEMVDNDAPVKKYRNKNYPEKHK